MSEKRRLIELPEKIDSEDAVKFAERLLELNQISDEPIDLLIDSDGGCSDAMLAIVELMRLSKAPIRTICSGRAFSSAAVILACGTHGRYALPHSCIMIHGVRIQVPERYQRSSAIPEPELFPEEYMHFNGRIVQILSEQTKKPEIEIERAISYDNYMYGEDALVFGMIDGFVTDLSLLFPKRYDWIYNDNDVVI